LEVIQPTPKSVISTFSNMWSTTIKTSSIVWSPSNLLWSFDIKLDWIYVHKQDFSAPSIHVLINLKYRMWIIMPFEISNNYKLGLAFNPMVDDIKIYTPPKINILKPCVTDTYCFWQCSSPSFQVPVLVLGHLSIHYWTLTSFAYGIQIRHTWCVGIHGWWWTI
jgi:hypothetical protein